MPLLTDDKCDCDWPVLWEVGNPVFLGRLVRVRVCCLMRDMEQRFETSYHETVDCEPIASWNQELTGLPVPDYLERRIAVKRDTGYKMEAPPESYALAEELASKSPDGSVANVIEGVLRRKLPNDEGLRKSWQR